jgi:hypothetical protein
MSQAFDMMFDAAGSFVLLVALCLWLLHVSVNSSR